MSNCSHTDSNRALPYVCFVNYNTSIYNCLIACVTLHKRPVMIYWSLSFSLISISSLFYRMVHHYALLQHVLISISVSVSCLFIPAIILCSYSVNMYLIQIKVHVVYLLCFISCVKFAVVGPIFTVLMFLRL
jgi:hypothetical protein